jgi:DNA-binding transcriptional regulator YiaG
VYDALVARLKKVDWDEAHVKALRQHLGLTQNEMADQLGTRQQTISEWETGIYRPRGTSSTLLNIIAERAGFTYGAESGTRPGSDDTINQNE